MDIKSHLKGLELASIDIADSINDNSQSFHETVKLLNALLLKNENDLIESFNNINWHELDKENAFMMLLSSKNNLAIKLAPLDWLRIEDTNHNEAGGVLNSCSYRAKTDINIFCKYLISNSFLANKITELKSEGVGARIYQKNKLIADDIRKNFINCLLDNKVIKGSDLISTKIMSKDTEDIPIFAVSLATNSIISEKLYENIGQFSNYLLRSLNHAIRNTDFNIHVNSFSYNKNDIDLPSLFDLWLKVANDINSKFLDLAEPVFTAIENKSTNRSNHLPDKKEKLGLVFLSGLYSFLENHINRINANNHKLDNNLSKKN